MPDKESCENCKFFYALSSLCRRRSPHVMIAQLGNEARVISSFPTVQTENWCGEHELRLSIVEN